MKVLGIIPARYASSRLPAKPLADINGKPMIQHVYERALQALPEVVVATDHERIVEAVEDFGGNVVLTSIEHSTGTNRCLEAFEKYCTENSSSIDVVVNIQGDEPLLDPKALDTLVKSFEDSTVEMATLSVKVENDNELFDENRVFVIMDKNKDALYFSRSPLPHVRGFEKKEWLSHHDYYKHLGLYAYTPKALKEFANMPTGSLEKAESLEQNRWMEAARKIRVQTVEHDSIPVDTPEDLLHVRNLMKSRA